MIQPIKDLLIKNSSTKSSIIYFVPHFILHYLPLHVLEIEDGKPIIEEYKIAYLPSSSLLQFYDFNNKMKSMKKLKTCTSFGIALEEKEKIFLDEADDIAKLFYTSPYLKVTKQDVLNHFPLKNDITHFSCHGQFSFDDPLLSCIQLQDKKLITARELFDKDLKIKSNLVTLSACETGVSMPEKGDELIGLPRTLLQAGAESVVVSLWSVSSISTKELMIAFYEKLKNGYDKASALQAAQLIIKKKCKNNIYLWAPFVLVGDWR